MELLMIGLGRMGFNMALRLLKGGHRVVGFTRDRRKVERFISEGGEGAFSLEDAVRPLRPPRAIWIMVPAGRAVDEVIQSLLPFLSEGDTIVDGGNSYYKDSMRRAEELWKKGIHLLDVGVSGGIWGLKEGYCLMIGGSKDVAERLFPIFRTLAPSPERGWGYVGPSGAGHFVKMIHNGIEYGMMEAIAEGFAILKKKEFGLDLHRIAEIWRYGSVIRSWLLDLVSQALEKDAGLRNIAPFVEDSGEGRWSVFEAIDLDISAPVITLSLLQRLRSRDSESFSDRLLAVMREEFGGHRVKREDDEE